ncbi:hypothetical protein [Mesorhizobium sp. M0145]
MIELEIDGIAMRVGRGADTLLDHLGRVLLCWRTRPMTPTASAS